MKDKTGKAKRKKEAEERRRLSVYYANILVKYLRQMDVPGVAKIEVR